MTVARQRPAASGFAQIPSSRAIASPVVSDRTAPAAWSRRPHTAGVPAAPDLMSSSEDQLQPTSSTTELLIATGDRYRVEGDPKEVERKILDAARGSLLQLAWLIEADTGRELAINPEHVVALRTAST
jgi:hypothetical protein